MSGQFRSVRGMRDLLAPLSEEFSLCETSIKKVLMAFGFQEIRLPVLEKTELFSHSLGENSDVVEKEMYSFVDKGGDSLCLRPEGTAACVRAALENSLLETGGMQRLFYSGPFFRRERPQKMRYRQFYQMGAECFGSAGPEVEAELLMTTALAWESLGISKRLTLKLNTVGDLEARRAYRSELADFFSGNPDCLPEGEQQRTKKDPLRLLDSKDPEAARKFRNAPKLQDYISKPCADHFARLLGLLDDLAIEYEIAPRLVRGLDYYSRTVFEWVLDENEGQVTVCAGGRFDGLFELLGGSPTPAAGLAIGIDRLVTLISEGLRKRDSQADVFLVSQGDAAVGMLQKTAQRIHRELPGLVMISDFERSFKSQLRRANKLGARFALIVGESELQNQKVGVKYLREDRSQMNLSCEEIPQFLRHSLSQTAVSSG